MAAADHASCHSRRLESQVRMEMVELRTLSTILFPVEWRESSTEPPKVKSLRNSYATVTYMCLTPRNGYESFFTSPLEETSCSVQFSRSVVSDSLRPHESQHARPLCPSPTPGVHSNSCPSSWWCHPAISSSVVPFSSCTQSLPASGSFPMSQLFAWGGQSIGISFSISPSNEHPGLISFRMDWLDLLAVQGLSRVFSNTTVQKHQFFGAQISSQSNPHIHTGPLEKP